MIQPTKNKLETRNSKLETLLAGAVVNVTVELYRQFNIGGKEIESIRPDSELPPEFAAKKLSSFELGPQNHFRIGLGRKNLPRAVERLEEYLSKQN